MKRLFATLALVLVVGVIAPTAQSLLLNVRVGNAQSTGFPFTIGTTIINGLSTVASLTGLSGLSFTYDTDPILDYNCAGVATTTTTSGTTSPGTSVIVASASGWSVGMGIAIQDAGSGGNTEHITTITGISGTTFTLAVATVSSIATGKTVNHDDTACLQAAITAGKNIHLLPSATYNVTSQLAIAAPLTVSGQGSAFNPHDYQSIMLSTAARTVIQNRGKTNNVFEVNSSFVILRDFAIIQASGITPTAGYAFQLEHASSFITGIEIRGVAVLNTFGCMSLGGGGLGHVISVEIHGNKCWSSTAPAFGMIAVNNPSPAGDFRFHDNEVRAPNAAGLYIAAADTNIYSNNKFNDCNATLGCVNIQAGAAQVFTSNSLEGPGSGTMVIVAGGTGMMFIGGEVGVATTGFNWSGTSTGSVESVVYNGITTPITNTSSGVVLIKGNFLIGGTNPSDTAPDGTASVNCTSGISATTGRAKGGIITAC